MFVCRSRSCLERNQQRLVKVCMHCHVVLIPESGAVQLAILMESSIALLTTRNPLRTQNSGVMIAVTYEGQSMEFFGVLREVI